MKEESQQPMPAARKSMEESRREFAWAEDIFRQELSRCGQLVRQLGPSKSGSSSSPE